MKALYLLCSALWLFTLEQSSLAHGRILEHRPTAQFRNLKQAAFAHGRIPALAACKASGIQLLPHDSKLATSRFSPVTDN